MQQISDFGFGRMAHLYPRAVAFCSLGLRLSLSLSLVSYVDVRLYVCVCKHDRSNKNKIINQLRIAHESNTHRHQLKLILEWHIGLLLFFLFQFFWFLSSLLFLQPKNSIRIQVWMKVLHCFFCSYLLCFALLLLSSFYFHSCSYVNRSRSSKCNHRNIVRADNLARTNGDFFLVWFCFPFWVD